jgi:hypothetical protein
MKISRNLFEQCKDHSSFEIAFSINHSERDECKPEVLHDVPCKQRLCSELTIRQRNSAIFSTYKMKIKSVFSQPETAEEARLKRKSIIFVLL